MLKTGQGSLGSRDPGRSFFGCKRDSEDVKRVVSAEARRGFRGRKGKLRQKIESREKKTHIEGVNHY